WSGGPIRLGATTCAGSSRARRARSPTYRRRSRSSEASSAYAARQAGQSSSR
ncbi:MAG: hypothetical protein AVDCRST_MAG45-1598, partial [uncultured Solirubrobacterales bacterium]